MNQHERLLDYLSQCNCRSDYDGIMKFHNDHADLIKKAKGSAKKHQAWPGGYVDHLVECMMIGELTYENLAWIRRVPFEWHSVVTVLYFHDVEKMWKYGGWTDEQIIQNPMAEQAVHGNKEDFYDEYLSNEPYLIDFSDEELNALEHIHGEKTYGEKRIIGPLGAFCHCCDMLSARMWYDHPTKEEIE